MAVNILTSPDHTNALWLSKAMAFVTRSHRHLWGKNNEDPLAFLFKRGLKNDFAKKMLLGWNKFGQNRPAENWGLDPADFKEGKLFLPHGIVFPYIFNKKLVSVFILSYENQNPKAYMVPGSLTRTIVLGDLSSPDVIVVKDLFKGLYQFQEAEGKTRILIHQNIRTDLYSEVSQ